MDPLPADLRRRIARLAADRTSGASEILEETVATLSAARQLGASTVDVARAVCQAQPAMAPVWNAAIAAVSSARAPQRLTQFVERLRRAPAALARFAASAFSSDHDLPLRLVTISSSRSVLVAVESVRATRQVQVSCSDSRPALEGRRLATTLATSGVPVTMFSDAAIGHALASSDAVLVGADAIGPDWFINKSGTRMLAAAAAFQGVPVYVAATRDKFVSRELAGRLLIGEGAVNEIWDAPPPGVELRNPYFEFIPLDLISSVISDIGVLGAAVIPDVCASIHDAVALDALEQIAR
jgi:translation initiation factor 2B subunit (eIF-2B alpha/beta/delta family)